MADVASQLRYGEAMLPARQRRKADTEPDTPHLFNTNHYCRSRGAKHMQKAMEQMNIKLSTVITDILGKSGMAIIRAIIDGNHNPNSLAQLADGRCRASKDTIAKSLDGTWDDDLLFVLKQSV